jgi:hypothetical protein
VLKIDLKTIDTGMTEAAELQPLWTENRTADEASI